MGQKSQQALNTVLASLIAVLLAERFDASLAAPGSRDMFVMAATVSLATGLSVLIEVMRQVALRWAQANGIDLTKILGTMVASVLVFLVTGCAGGFASAPATYRDAITCSEDLKWEQAGDSFVVTCAGRAKWSGPPSDAEVSDAAAKLKAALEALGG